MQLMRLADVPVNPRERVFCYSRLQALSGGLLLAVIAAGLIVFARLKGAWPTYFVAAVLLACLVILQKVVTARFRRPTGLCA